MTAHADWSKVIIPACRSYEKLPMKQLPVCAQLRTALRNRNPEEGGDDLDLPHEADTPHDTEPLVLIEPGSPLELRDL